MYWMNIYYPFQSYGYRYGYGYPDYDMYGYYSNPFYGYNIPFYGYYNYYNYPYLGMYGFGY